MSDFAAAHELLRSCDKGRNPGRAMQIVLNLPKQDPPQRNHVLQAAARACVAACLECGHLDEFDAWYGESIRKVARRSRNKAWRDVQELPGYTVDNLARAFVPFAEVDHRIGKLQVGHTDLPVTEPEPLLSDVPTIYLDSSLEMTMGKAAAQVGHASMLLAADMTFDEVTAWRAQDYALNVREVDADEFARVSRGAVVVQDAGFTEIAPGSITCAARRAA